MISDFVVLSRYENLYSDFDKVWFIKSIQTSLIDIQGVPKNMTVPLLLSGHL